MTRWARPVRAAALFASPELALRTAGEQQLSSYGADEGEGTGFDGLDASAMASRVWVAAGEPHDVLREYRDALVDLGWHQAYVHSEDWLELARDGDECLHLQVLQPIAADRCLARLRLVLKVRGSWPPGREPWLRH